MIAATPTWPTLLIALQNRSRIENLNHLAVQPETKYKMNLCRHQLALTTQIAKTMLPSCQKHDQKQKSKLDLKPAPGLKNQNPTARRVEKMC